MSAIREWLSRVWGTVRGNRRDAEMEEELKLHLDWPLRTFSGVWKGRRTRCA
jgi:hypothetical protein